MYSYMYIGTHSRLNVVSSTILTGITLITMAYDEFHPTAPLCIYNIWMTLKLLMKN